MISADACEGVLLVEDDDDIRLALVEALRDEGIAVRAAANGADALQDLRQGSPPCLIVLDLMMPVMDGWQFRDKQLEDPTLAEIPVVVLTADGNAKAKAAKMNAALGMSKPVRLDDLIQVIVQYCGPAPTIH
jgi:CheY-like chemotaxis protein